MAIGKGHSCLTDYGFVALLQLYDDHPWRNRSGYGGPSNSAGITTALASRAQQIRQKLEEPDDLIGSPVRPHPIVQLDRVRPNEDTERRQFYVASSHPGDEDVKRLGLAPGRQGSGIGDRIHEQISLLGSTPEKRGLSYKLGPTAKT